MGNQKNTTDNQQIKRQDKFGLILLLAGVVFIFSIGLYTIFINGNKPSLKQLVSKENSESHEIENGIHLKTGLIEANGLMAVVNNCTVCHSAQLVMQNRMNKERWNATIRWMQETQNLWPLGENQKIIVDYLVKNYPPIEKGRRTNLEEIKWYVLED